MRSILKRITACLMIVAMTVGLIGETRVFASPTAHADHAWADYTQFHGNDPVITMECGLVFGGLSVPGQFVVEQNISRDRINELIEQVLKDNHITDQQMQALRSKIQDMQNRYKLNANDFLSALEGELGIDVIITAGIGKIDDYAVAALHGDLSHLTDVIAFAIGMVGVAGSAPETFSAALLSLAASLGLTSVLRAIQDAIDNGKDMELAQGIMAAAAMDSVYDEVNRRIDKEAGDLHKKIVFKGSTVASFENRSVFGVGGNTLFLSVDGVLEAGVCGKQRFQSELEKPGYFSGIYSGSLTVKASYDASQFDAQFLKEVFKHFPGKAALDQFFEQHDAYYPSIIKKEVRFSDVTVSVDSRRERFGGTKKTAYPKFSGGTETNTCVIDHTVRCAMKAGLFDDGHYSIAGDTGNDYIDYSFCGKIADSYFGQVIINRADITENYSVKVPYVSYFMDFSKEFEGVNRVLLTDNDLFWFLKKTPYLYYNLNTYKEHDKSLLY